MSTKIGSGTDVCVSCRGPKEPSRRKSKKCRSCDKSGATGSYEACCVWLVKNRLVRPADLTLRTDVIAWARTQGWDGS